MPAGSLFGENAVVGAEVAATDREVLHVDEDLSRLQGRCLGLEDLELPGTDNTRRFHSLASF